MKVKAVYRQGAFFPADACDLPEGARVELTVDGPLVSAPEVTDPQEKLRLLHEITDRMRRNPLPQDAPRFTRDQVHDRG